MRNTSYLDGNKQPMQKGIYKFANHYWFFDEEFPSDSSEPLILTSETGNTTNFYKDTLAYCFPLEDPRQEEQALRKHLRGLQRRLDFLQTNQPSRMRRVKERARGLLTRVRQNRYSGADK